MKMRFFSIMVSSFLLLSCGSTDSTKAQTITNVNAVEFNELVNSGEGILLDVRTGQEVASGHIEGATNIDFYKPDFSKKLNLMRKDVPIYVYCRSGNRSGKAAKQMKDMGFVKVYNLDGGIGAWANANNKIVRSKQQAPKQQEVVSIEAFKNIIATNKTVLVDFSTQWCVPCKKMLPVMDELKKELAATVKVVMIDADANPELIKHYNVQGVPAFVVFKDGAEVWRKSGTMTKASLKKQLN